MHQEEDFTPLASNLFSSPPDLPSLPLRRSQSQSDTTFNRISAAPADNGVTRLSSIGEGIHSASIPTTAATIALKGSMNRVDPRNAQANPKIVPSKFFFLLKKRGVFPKIFPKMVAKPSPSVRTAMDTQAILVGKIRSVRIIPIAKDIGAVTKSFILELDAAFRVIVENTGTLIPLVLASSETT